MPTPSWTVSFTMPTASNSPAKACAGHEANRTRRLDQPPSPVTQIHRPAKLATRAASFRYGGRHHSGIPGDIIPLYPGDFVGIRRPSARWTSSVYREPRSIAGMIVTVRATLKHWPIIGRGRTGSGTASRTMSAARSSIWRWNCQSCRRESWPCGSPTSGSILSRRLQSIGC
jgi:hypothetical protein